MINEQETLWQIFFKTAMKEYHSLVKVLENTKIASSLRYFCRSDGPKTSIMEQRQLNVLGFNLNCY